ncbi:hypothetical protein BD310DRAFT_632927 [Dichomitus squalens]|uniref:Uncharacterized protein n=1 Tax=Dichomitus squalens TaxID=114155 RepID=A0A4Q9PPK1_9APHY|nr:hypothetical protein BD310DRAFT_632927 [Dichomitus squalens]
MLRCATIAVRLSQLVDALPSQHFQKTNRRPWPCDTCATASNFNVSRKLSKLSLAADSRQLENGSSRQRLTAALEWCDVIHGITTDPCQFGRCMRLNCGSHPAQGSGVF